MSFHPSIAVEENTIDDISQEIEKRLMGLIPTPHKAEDVQNNNAQDKLKGKDSSRGAEFFETSATDRRNQVPLITLPSLSLRFPPLLSSPLYSLSSVLSPLLPPPLPLASLPSLG